MVELKAAVFARQQALDSRVVDELGLRSEDPLVNFYKRYQGPFASQNTAFTLLELEGSNPSASIVAATRVVRERFGWPLRYIVLTDLVADSVYVYDAKSGSVFNVDFEGGDQLLLSGSLEPEFQSLQHFLQWFLSGEF